jgi:4-hydroxy-tetrahydrodipicolinate synthase
MTLGGVLTAMVTPFGPGGGLDEEAAADLIRHLLANGSDGVVLAGTTGEGSTVTDDEDVALWELGVEVAGGATVIAGTGTNDTRHSIALTERAAACGVDAALVVTPYYNRPNRAGLLAHYEAVAGATDLPLVVYNVPHRTGTDMPNDLLAELGQIPGIEAVKQARYEDLAPIDGLNLLCGNDDVFAQTLDMGGTGGILVASHLVGSEMRRMIDEPDNRHEIQDGLKPVYEALSVAPLAASVKASLKLLGRDVGAPRLPLVEPNPDEVAVLRSALESQGLLERV